MTSWSKNLLLWRTSNGKTPPILSTMKSQLNVPTSVTIRKKWLMKKGTFTGDSGPMTDRRRAAGLCSSSMAISTKVTGKTESMMAKVDSSGTTDANTWADGEMARCRAKAY